jgi:hypothetical protein
VNNILPFPQVLVLCPNGGETLVVNQNYTIKWTLTVGAHQIFCIYVDYTYNGGSSWMELANLSNATTSLIWQVNNTPSVNCLVRVRAVDIANNTGMDTSNETFAIVGACVKSITIGNCNVSIAYKGAGIENITVKSASSPGNIPANLKDIGLFVDITGNITDAYITITYSDEDITGIDESKLKLYYWNETTSSWVLVPESGVRQENNTVWAKIDHLTIFAPLSEKLTEEVEGAQPYPQPPQILPVVTYTTIISVAILIAIICIAVVLKRRQRK